MPKRRGDFIGTERVVASNFFFHGPTASGRSEISDQPGRGAAAKARHSRDQGKPAFPGIDQMIPYGGLIDSGAARGEHGDERNLTLPGGRFDESLVGAVGAIERLDQGLDRAVERFARINGLDHALGGSREASVCIGVGTERDRYRVRERPQVISIKIAQIDPWLAKAVAPAASRDHKRHGGSGDGGIVVAHQFGEQ